jgi:NADH-quinone oxidoreductase subunit L
LWFEKPSAADASKKAFLVNRVADVGFMVGILMLWGATGVTSTGRTFNFLEQTALVSSHAVTPAMLGCAGLLIFCGVLGKSAQFPLHVWLPDAMEGPTPVSALIHAATMVAAGIYLLSRAFFVFVELPETMYIIAWVGGGTALLAALIAIVQSDLKRILAYSTLSQLGYMVMALGLGGYTAGMYHLTTHACFKALLFLAAGSVIRALHHEQNIWRMGGLVTQMPITTWTFAIGTFALCGIPPLSGFWSKDEILTVALQQHHVLYLMGTCTAGLTAFYMGRALFVTFGGTARSEHTAHESPFTMTFPLICLAILSLGAGYIGIPHFIHHHHGVHVAFSMRVATISTAVAITGLTLAYLLYVRLPHVPVQLATRLSFLHHVLTQKFFVDAFYSWVVRYVQGSLAWLCAQFERFILIGCMVNGVAWATRSAGHLLRLCQTGHVQTYGIVFLAGVVLLTWHWLRPW